MACGPHVKIRQSDKTLPSTGSRIRRLELVKTLHRFSSRRLWILSVAAVFLPFSLPAQSTPADNRERAEARIEELKQRLQLTPEQVERMTPVLRREAEQMREVLRHFDRDSASLREKRKVARQLKSIRDEAAKQLEPILTPAQRKEFARIREERAKELRERLRGNG